MAVTDFDRQAITRQEDLDALQKITDRYNAAAASGNQAEMQLAAKNAAMLRSAYGYHTNADGTSGQYYTDARRYNPSYIIGSGSVTRGQANAFDNTPYLDYGEKQQSQTGSVDWSKANETIRGSSGSSNNSPKRIYTSTTPGLNYVGNNSSNSSNNSRSNYINNLIDNNSTSYPKTYTPFSRYVTQNMYNDRYF